MGCSAPVGVSMKALQAVIYTDSRHSMLTARATIHDALLRDRRARHIPRTADAVGVFLSEKY